MRCGISAVNLWTRALWGAGLGGRLAVENIRQKTQNDILRKLALKMAETRTELLNDRNETENTNGENFGGRSRNRTYDLAHVRRAL